MDNSKAIFVNMSDEAGQELYRLINIYRVTNGLTWKQLVLASLANNPELNKPIGKYLK
jgi:hypothetical protein